MAQNGGILACLTAFWTPKFYSWGTSAVFWAIRPPLEAYWAGQHTGKCLKEIAACILRMQPLLGSKMLQGAPSGPVCQNTIFDIPGAAMVRFGPSEARSNENWAYNTVRSDLVGPHTMHTKLSHFPVSSQSANGAQFEPF